MSVSTININKFQQNFEKTLNKEKYGEVNTDFELIIKMLDLIPSNYYKNPKLKWLDPTGLTELNTCRNLSLHPA